MAFQPDFMEKTTEFTDDKRKIRSLDDWLAFQRKWFDRARWPEKTPSQRAAESVKKQGPVKIAGRTWGYTSWTYDLTPEARYEYFAALRTIADPLKFPDEAGVAKTAADGWRQECPFDEISTDQLGGQTCPLCGRRLLYVRYSD